MKIQVAILCFLFYSITGSSQNKNDSISLLPMFKPFMYSKNKVFNPFMYSENLKRQLSPYILKIDGIDNNKMYSLSYKNYYFEDYYTIYKDDLGKFIPQPPDITNQFIPL